VSMAVLPVPMGMGVPMFFAASMPHGRDFTLRSRLFTRVRRIRILRSSYTRSSPKFDKKSVRMQPARMMHTGARACMLADVQSGDSDLHPV
jgi:hypothetical protein